LTPDERPNHSSAALSNRKDNVMNTQEKVLVNRLVTRIAEAPQTAKDPEAELEITALLRLRPDAPYLLLQRALMLEAALEQAHLKLDQMQPMAAASPIQQITAPASAASAAAPSPAPIAGSGGFLRNAATIGAGVLGGSLLFQGIESLLHGGRGSDRGMSQAPAEVFETNNFIQSADGMDRPGRGESLAGLDGASLMDDTAIDVDSDTWA
jgi:hypothetical protein